MRRAIVFAVALVAVAATTGTPVRADGPISVVVASADDSGFPTVTAVVLADNSGMPLTTLAPAAVTVRENGLPAQVTSVTSSTGANIPLELVLVMDTSGSMAGGTLAAAQSAAVGLLNSLAPGDQAALISFDTEVRVEQPSTTDRSAVVAAIGKLSAHGNTALYDAVASAADLASKGLSMRRAVVLLTDGEDYGGLSTLTRESSLSRSTASHTIFYTIGVGASVDSAYLEQLADGSGGRFFPAPQATDLGAIYGAIQDRLRSYFVITVHSAADSNPGAMRTITVSIQSGSNTATASLRYESRRPAAVPRSEPPAPSPTVVAESAVPPPAGSGSGGSGWLPIIGGAVVLLLPTAASALLIARRRRAPLSARSAGAILVAGAGIHVGHTDASEDTARGLILSVTQFGEMRSFDIERALRLGTAADNEIVLADDVAVAPHHARIWPRDGRVMLHHLAPGFQTLLSGEPVDWASLTPGAVVTIGTASVTVATRIPLTERARRNKAETL